MTNDAAARPVRRRSTVGRSVRWVTGRPAAIVRDWRAIGLATFAGVLVFTSYPNFDVFPNAFVALVPLMFAVRERTVGAAFALGAWTGTVTNLGGFYWIIGLMRDFGGMPAWVGALLLLLLAMQQGMTFAFAAAGARWLERRGWMPVAWSWVPAWALVESLWPMIFKWYLGNSQWKNHALAQLTELGGVVLVSVAVVLANVAAYHALVALRAKRRPGAGVAVACALVVVAHLWGMVRIAQVDAASQAAETLHIGLVEADIGIFEKSDPEFFRNNLLIHQHLSAQLADDGVELILWPETAYSAPSYYVSEDTGAQTVDEARQTARVVGRLPRGATWMPPSRAPLVDTYRDDEAMRTPPGDRFSPLRGYSADLLVGAVMVQALTEDEARAYPPRGGAPRRRLVYNSAVLLGDDGRVHGVYDKNELMPFSEYFAPAHWLYDALGINLWDAVPMLGDFVVGERVPPLELPRDGGDPWRLGILICYEDIMPGYGRHLGHYRPHVLLNVTNDAWFGQTSEPALHLALATFRSIEQRTWLVRSTNTGISAFVDPVGRVVSETSLEDAEVLSHHVPMLEATRTPFVVIGNWPAWAAAIGIGVGAWLARRRRRGKGQGSAASSRGI